eukprot:TRINITY_DN3268_c0_g1_i1.p1 TRINITY_DN3268_c0_g1~~TRINITY_DN3268_c0_g1_i1.p1  ORF type:complete len:427 (+),score=122.93 TRINITY_DN3268_c0_g1_i1:75-1355(+)
MSSSSSSSSSSASKDRYQTVDVTRDGRAIAAKGSKIEFKAPTGDTLSAGYQARYQDSQVFSPRKIFLQDAGRSMLLLTPDRRSTLVKYDTEYGKNIGEVSLKIADTLDYPIDSITTPSKFSELQQSPVVQAVGVSGNSLFDVRWDSRSPGDVLALSEDQRFVKASRNFRFTSVATTGAGHVVAGSNDGHIRLFTRKNDELEASGPMVSPWKRPKTDLGQLADKVTGVDTTRDGTWVVWTTDKYIAVVNTTFKTGGHVASGFEKAMGKEKPSALICKLSDQDLEAMGITEDDVHFTTATFDQGTYMGDDNILEQNIVTSTGPFMVRWKFRHIKNDYGKTRDRPGVRRAEVVRQKEEITARKFTYDKDEVVAALESDLSFMKLSGEEDDQEAEEEESPHASRVLKFNAGDDDYEEEEEDDEDDEEFEP